MGDENTPLTTQQARHLLRRTGFGAPPNQVAEIDGRTRGQVADELLDFNPTKFKPRGRDIDTVQDRWIKYMVRRVDGRGVRARRRALQEKLVLFWHDHFATSYVKVQDARAMRKQNQTLRIHCKGNFSALLKAINKDPAMMNYLDISRSTRYAPNENYARELQELFTLGVKDFQGNANYRHEDIVQIARAFTGWDYTNNLATYFDGDNHNTIGDDGPKIVYQQHGNLGGGVNFAQPEGDTEVDQVIDIILQHTDTDAPAKNTSARYITRKLFSYFAYGNPDANVVDGIISRSNFDGAVDAVTAWNLTALLRELFVDDAFYAGAQSPPFLATSKKSVRWPIDFVVGTMSSLHMRFRGSDAYVDGGSRQRVIDQLANMGQDILFPPSVFGWDWEEKWWTSSTLLSRCRFARDVIAARGGNSRVYLRPAKLLNLVGLNTPPQNAGLIVDEVLRLLGVIDQFYTVDQLSTVQRDALVAYLTEPGPVTSHVDLTDEDVVDEKIRGLFLLVLESPASHVF